MVDWQSESDLDSIRNSCDVLCSSFVKLVTRRELQCFNASNNRLSWDIKCIEFSAKNPSMQTAYSQEARQRLENIKIEHVAALIPGGQYVLASILLCIFLLTWLFVNSKLKTIFSVNVKFQKPFETRKHNERCIFESLRSSTSLCYISLFSVLTRPKRSSWATCYY